MIKSEEKKNYDENFMFINKINPISLNYESDKLYDFENKFIDKNIFLYSKEIKEEVVDPVILPDMNGNNENKKIEKYYDETVNKFDYHINPPEINELHELQNDYETLLNSIITINYEIYKNNALIELFDKTQHLVIKKKLLYLTILISYVITNLLDSSIKEFLIKNGILKMNTEKEEKIQEYNKEFGKNDKETIFMELLKLNKIDKIIGGSNVKQPNNLLHKLVKKYLVQESDNIYSSNFINLDASIYQNYVTINEDYNIENEKNKDDYIPLIHKNDDIKNEIKSKELFESNVLEDKKLHYLNKYLELEMDEKDNDIPLENKLRKIFNVFDNKIINWEFVVKDPYIEEYNRYIESINLLKIVLSDF